MRCPKCLWHDNCSIQILYAITGPPLVEAGSTLSSGLPLWDAGVRNWEKKVCFVRILLVSRFASSFFIVRVSKFFVVSFRLSVSGSLYRIDDTRQDVLFSICSTFEVLAVILAVSILATFVMLAFD